MEESSTLSCDPDRWSYFEIMSILKEMSYVNVNEMWYSIGGNSMLEGRLELLINGKGSCHMVNIATLNGQHCHTEWSSALVCCHLVSEPQIIHMLEFYGPKVDGNKGDCMNEVRGEDECEDIVRGRVLMKFKHVGQCS